jgi:D-glycerate 3-kinase
MNLPPPKKDEYKKIYTKVKPNLLKLAKELYIEDISDNFFLDIVIPLSDYFNSFHKKNIPYFIGLTGGQGSGKTTLSIFIQQILNEVFKKRAVGFSIDDIYKTKEERDKIARKIHPLCSVRGVPGTHDIELGIDTIENLYGAQPNTYTYIPSFSKIMDKHYPKKDWKKYKGKPDFIFFDAWCGGAKPIPENKWKPPLNKLEKEKDPYQIWARWSNNELAGDYQKLFNRFDKLIFIQVEKMENVYENRWLQEKAMSKGIKDKKLLKNIMDKNQIKSFVMHYERLTRHILDEMPDQADIVINREDKFNFFIEKNKNFFN